MIGGTTTEQGRDHRSGERGLLDGQYGIKEFCVSLPSVVNANGVHTVRTPSLAGDQLVGLLRSADAVRSITESCRL